MKPGDAFNPYRRFHVLLVPQPIAACVDLSPGAKLAYGALARRAGRDGSCFPSHEVLAADLGTSTRNAKHYLSELRDYKLVRWCRGRYCNNYEFLWHELLTDRTNSSYLNSSDRTDVSHLEGSDRTESSYKESNRREESQVKRPTVPERWDNQQRRVLRDMGVEV